MSNLRAQFIGELNGRVDLLVAPDVQIVEFGIDQADIGFQPAYQLQSPVPEWEFAVALREPMRIAHESVVFKVRPEKCHSPRSRLRRAVTVGPRHNLSERFTRVEPTADR